MIGQRRGQLFYRLMYTTKKKTKQTKKKVIAMGSNLDLSWIDSFIAENWLRNNFVYYMYLRWSMPECPMWDKLNNALRHWYDLGISRIITELLSNEVNRACSKTTSLKTVFGTGYHPLLSEEGLGAALGYSPEPEQVSESLVRCWGRVECQNKRIVQLAC